MKYEYPLSPTYVPDWDLKRALREVIANAIDAEHDHNSPMKLSYDAAHQRVRVANPGVTLPRTVLMLGNSTKVNDEATIGEKGEGLKLAMLIFAREGLICRIRNGYDELWTPKIEYSDRWHGRVLVVEVAKSKRQTCSFEVEVQGITPELWEEVRELFLCLKTPPLVATPYGDLLEGDEYRGRVYVKGVYVCQAQNMSCGYNFKQLDIGRDRQIPASWQMDDHIARMWNHRVETNPETASHVFDLLALGGQEAQALRYEYTDALLDKLVAEYEARFGDAVPVTSTGEAVELEHLGVRSRVVSAQLAGLLGKRLPTVEKVKAERKHDVTRRYGPDELSAEEREVLTTTLALLEDGCGLAEPTRRVCVVDFQSSKILGLHKGRDIYLARKELASVGGAFAVLAHEFAHDFGGDGTKEHVDAIHELTVAAINHLTRRKNGN